MPHTSYADYYCLLLCQSKKQYTSIRRARNKNSDQCTISLIKKLRLKKDFASVPVVFPYCVTTLSKILLCQ